MKASRLTKLERAVRERPCPGCGSVCPVPDPAAPVPDWERLDAGDRDELAGLLAAVATPACTRCGRSGYDLTRATDEQLHRTLELLRVAFGRESHCPG